MGKMIRVQFITNHERLAEYKGKMSWTSPIEVHGDIMLVHNGAPFLDELATLAEQHHDKLAECQVVGADGEAYTDKTQRSSRRVTLTDNAALPDPFKLYPVMLRSIEGSFAYNYMEIVNPHAKVDRACGYDLLRYGPGDRFGVHVDAVRDHPVLAHRRLAVVAFCNKVEEGGELHFPRQDLTIRPEPGLFVLFPAGLTHPHESKAVVRGVKYSVVTWFF